MYWFTIIEKMSFPLYIKAEPVDENTEISESKVEFVIKNVKAEYDTKEEDTIENDMLEIETHDIKDVLIKNQYNVDALPLSQSYDPVSYNERAVLNHIDLVPDNIDNQKDCYTSKCDICGKEFTNKVVFHRHLRIHNKCSDFKCFKCGKILKSKKNLSLHKLNMHADSNYFECEKCGKKFRTKRNLIKHINMRGDSHVFDCDKCGKVLRYKSELSYHLSTAHSKSNDFDCFKCGKIFQTGQKLANHMNTLHKHENPVNKINHLSVTDTNIKKTYLKSKCHICGKKFSYLKSFRSHLESHQDPCECVECGIIFKSKQHLSYHLKMEHSQDSNLNTVSDIDIQQNNRKSKCGICGKEFAALESFRKHLESHEDSCECITCGKLFKSRPGLLYHLKTQHRYEAPANKLEQLIESDLNNMENNQKFKCDVCKKVFAYLKPFRKHLESHEDPCKCVECGKMFKTKQHLSYHLKSERRCQSPVNEIKCLLIKDKKNDISNDITITCEGNPVLNSSEPLDLKSNLIDLERGVSINNIIPITHEGIEIQHRTERLDLKANFVDYGRHVSEIKRFSLVDKYNQENHHKLPKCHICGEQFITKVTFQKHMEIHNDSPNFECVKCKKMFKTEKYFLIHMFNFHTDSDYFECEKCGKKFKTKKNLLRHIIKHGDSKCYNCNKCRKIFRCKLGLEYHSKTAHSNSYDFDCVKCGKEFKTRQSLSNHFKTMHRPDSPVNEIKDLFVKNRENNNKSISGKEFSRLEYLQKHLENHHDTCECLKCGKVFKNKHYLSNHMNKVHVISYDHKCGKCGKVFKNKNYLSSHTSKMHSSLEYECVKCRKVFKNKMYLTRHTKSVHFDSFNFECDMCEKKFETKRVLLLHLKVHADTDCKICGKVLNTRRSLSSHIKSMHTVSNDYK